MLLHRLQTPSVIMIIVSTGVPGKQNARKREWRERVGHEAHTILFNRTDTINQNGFFIISSPSGCVSRSLLRSLHSNASSAPGTYLSHCSGLRLHIHTPILSQMQITLFHWAHFYIHSKSSLSVVRLLKYCSMMASTMICNVGSHDDLCNDLQEGLHCGLQCDHALRHRHHHHLLCQSLSNCGLLLIPHT